MIGQRAQHGIDAVAAQFRVTGGIADQAADIMARLDQPRGDRSADEAAGAGDENLHGVFLFLHLATQMENDACPW